MKSDITRTSVKRFAGGRFVDAIGACGFPLTAALNVAGAHLAFALLLQLGNYGFYLAGNGPTATLTWAQLMSLPAAQISSLTVAALLGCFAALGQGRAASRHGVFLAALACNVWLVVDQRVYAVFFVHFTPELVDPPAWRWFVERVFARIDPMLFVALAGLTGATVWTHHGLWRTAVSIGVHTVPPVANPESGSSSAKRPLIAGALAVAVIAAMVIISVNVELRGLNHHPLAMLFYEKLIAPNALNGIQPQVNVHVPRYGSMGGGGDPLDDSGLATRLADFGGARPNLVLMQMKFDPLDMDKTAQPGRQAFDGLLNFQNLVPGMRSSGAMAEEMMSRLREAGYATALFATHAQALADADQFAADPCALMTAPSGFHAWMRERREAGVPVAVHVVLVADQVAQCMGDSINDNALTSALLETFTASGWAHQTVFAQLIEPAVSGLRVGEHVAAGIATMAFALAVPGRMETTLTSARAGTVEDAVATLYYLLGLQPPAGKDLLSPQWQPRNLFWVHDGVEPYWGVRDGDWIYQASALGTAVQLYNVAVDPAQKSNLAFLLPRQAALYRRLCATWFAVEGHDRVTDKSAFVANARGWWLPMDLSMAGPKYVDFGLTGERPIPRHTTLRRFNPYDPVIAQFSLRPFGEPRSLKFEWISPAGAVNAFTFNVQSVWNKVWTVPDRDFPMTPGRWIVRVSEGKVPLVAGEFWVDAGTPKAQPWASEPRTLLEIVPGVFGPLDPSTGAPEFHPRERFVSGETPVVQTRWAAGSGVHKLTFTWRSPRGEIFTREHGLREEWEALRAELNEPAQPWTPGEWQVTVHESGTLLGTVVVQIDEVPQ